MQKCITEQYEAKNFQPGVGWRAALEKNKGNLTLDLIPVLIFCTLAFALRAVPKNKQFK